MLYADDTSFTFMTPQGHMFGGWITFSAERNDDATTVQAQMLLRASDPLYEVGLSFGGHKKEDDFWKATLTKLAGHLGVEHPVVGRRVVCVDPKRQWALWKNLWYNSAIRSVGQTIAGPVRRPAKTPR